MYLKGILHNNAHNIKDKYWLSIANANITKPNLFVNSIEITSNEKQFKNMVEIVFDKLQVFYVPEFHFDYRAIKKFTVINSHLKIIHREDLKQFSNLKILWLQRNDLEVIESNLFDSNRDLEEINLNQNKIWFVGQNTFKSLLKLKTFNFSNNWCITENVELNSLNDIMNQKCYFMTKQLYTIERNMKVLTEEFKNLNNSNNHQEIFNLNNEYQKLRNDHQDLKTEYEALKNNQKSTEQEIEKLKEILTDQNLSEPVNSSNSSLIITQTFVIVFFIILLIIACIYFYTNRLNILVMNKSYKLPSDEDFSTVGSSATIELQLSNENLCEIKNESVKFKKPVTKLPPIIIPTMTAPLNPIKISDARNKNENPSNLTVEADIAIHSKGPALPPRKSMIEIKKKLEEPKNEVYDEIWKAETSDDEIEKDKNKIGEFDIFKILIYFKYIYFQFMEK